MVSNQIRHNTVENFRKNQGLALTLPSQLIPILGLYHRSLSGGRQHGSQRDSIQVAEAVGGGRQLFVKQLICKDLELTLSRGIHARW
jgi:hypothetical protein